MKSFSRSGGDLPITIKDIARMANVSTASVSRVLNCPDLVKDEKRAMIEKIIEENNYRPNALARSLIRKASKAIGVIIPDINNLFYPAVIRGVEDTFEKNKYNIFLCNTDKNIRKEIKYINTLLERRVDGIVFMGTRPIDPKKSEHIKLLAKRVPVLLINDYIIGDNIFSVSTDEVAGAYKAVNYLIELGHRKIGFINGEIEFTTYQCKQKGYEMALAEHGIRIDENLIKNDMPYSCGGYKNTLKLLAYSDAPTAIFTASDQIALGVIKALLESSYKVPEHMSVIGYANIPISADIYPELTTVDQLPYETGRLAAETLVKAIKGEILQQKRMILEPKLLVRKSCKELI